MDKIKNMANALRNHAFLVIGCVFLVLFCVSIFVYNDNANAIIGVVGLYSCLILDVVEDIKRKINKPKN